MLINDNDIARTARQLRDEQNATMHVKPWRKSRHNLPQWLVTIPAAAVIGFVAGLFIGSGSDPADVQTLSQRIDTLYITRQVVSETTTDEPSHTTAQQQHKRQTAAAMRRAKQSADAKPNYTTGIPASRDGIRYDMLVAQ